MLMNDCYKTSDNVVRAYELKFGDIFTMAKSVNLDLSIEAIRKHLYELNEEEYNYIFGLPLPKKIKDVEVGSYLWVTDINTFDFSRDYPCNI